MNIKRHSGKISQATKLMRNNARLIYTTPKKLEPTDENVRGSVARLLIQLGEESLKYADSDDIHLKLLLCQVLSVVGNSSEEKSIIENNVQYFCDFIQHNIEIAIKEKFDEKDE